jgi:hypothetical protein
MGSLLSNYLKLARTELADAFCVFDQSVKLGDRIQRQKNRKMRLFKDLEQMNRVTELVTFCHLILLGNFVKIE